MKHLLVATFILACASAGRADDADQLVKGKQLYGRCQPCHSLDNTNRVGPPLLGIIGERVGIAPGFVYSYSMRSFSSRHDMWDEATLDAFLANPKAVIPGTKMAFAGMKSAEDRSALIAFLKTQQ